MLRLYVKGNDDHDDDDDDDDDGDDNDDDDDDVYIQMYAVIVHSHKQKASVLQHSATRNC